MAFLTSAYIGDMVGTAKRDALTPTGTVFTSYVAMCDARTVAACRKAGYAVDSTTVYTGDTLEILRAMSLYTYVKGAHLLRRDIVLEEDILNILINPDLVASGEFPIPGLSANQLGAEGGAQITSGTGAGGINNDDERIFTRSNLWGF